MSFKPLPVSPRPISPSTTTKYYLWVILLMFLLKFTNLNKCPPSPANSSPSAFELTTMSKLSISFNQEETPIQTMKRRHIP